MSRMRRILVVEDEPGVRGTIVKHLQRRGFDVRGAGSAEDALLQSFRESTPYDLVLTDIHLPGLSGVDLSRILMAHSPLRPVLVITGDPDEKIARNAFSFGVTGYLLKPFELFELDAVVAQALGRLELLEATQALARADAERLADRGARGGAIPPAWVVLADERSGADRGHGFRVARLCGNLVTALAGRMTGEESDALDVAARVHEVGRLLGPTSNPVELASRTAQFLTSLGMDPATVRVVRHHFEAWDGTGGPDGLVGGEIPAGSAVLRVADTVDHLATERVGAGDSPAVAFAAAVDDVLEGSGRTIAPYVADAVRDGRHSLEAIWVLSRSASA